MMFGIGDIVITHVCPHCGRGHYRVLYSSTTAVMWHPIYKDGQLINHNPNVTTNYCRCMECGEGFSFEE